MCAETLPWRCHRRLIGDFLTAREVDVVHLLAPGSSIEHRPFADAEVRDGRLSCAGRLSRKRHRRQPPWSPSTTSCSRRGHRGGRERRRPFPGICAPGPG
jgi:hypothetical protein